MNILYSNVPGLVLGFHGCDQATFESVIYRGKDLRASVNKYDWLGNGIYFWENGYQRALDWAQKAAKRKDSRIKSPAVIGAVIDLGFCLNLLDISSTEIIRAGYDALVELFKMSNKPLPRNIGPNKSGNELYRNLDCAVIEQIHDRRKQNKARAYDSVRGFFDEGDPIYEGSGFFEKSHIQLCIRNPNCIKGYFIPRHFNSGFINP